MSDYGQMLEIARICVSQGGHQGDPQSIKDGSMWKSLEPGKPSPPSPAWDAPVEEAPPEPPKPPVRAEHHEEPRAKR
jgi:hypothetical protein